MADNSKGATDILKTVQTDKMAGAKAIDLPKIDTFSDMNSDLNFLANVKKTYPYGQSPKPPVVKPTTSPLRNEITPSADGGGANDPGKSPINSPNGLDIPQDNMFPHSFSSEDDHHGLGEHHSSKSTHSDMGSSISKKDPKRKPSGSKPSHITQSKIQKPMTEEEIRREKAFLLFQYESKNKDFRYSKAHLSMNSSLEEIKNEIELINSKRAMESNMSFYRRGMIFLSEGIVYLNNTFDPFSVEMSDWSKQMAYEVMEEKSYDELLEELVMKYKSSGISAPVEIRLALAVGASFGFGVIAKKRENAILERVQHSQAPSQPMYTQVPNQVRQQTHGPSMNADDVIKMMQESGGIADSSADDAKSDASSEIAPSKTSVGDQSVITIPSSGVPKKRGRKPKAKEPETVLKL